MGKKGGFLGGMGMPGNIGNLMKQAQKMQKQMEEASKALEEAKVTGTAGGGVVEITVSGKKEILSVKIDKDVVDPEDVETLEDLIVAALNDAMKKVDDMSAGSMSKFTGGMGPNLFG